MSGKKPEVTDEEVYAECQKLYPNFPVGLGVFEAMMLLRDKRKELEAKPKLRIVH